MKAIALFVCLLFAGPAFGQMMAAAPFKGANEIVVTVPDSSGAAYALMARAFATAGYQLDKADKELGIVSTRPHPAPRLNMLCAYSAMVLPSAKGSVVSIRGTSSLPGAAGVSPLLTGESVINYRGMSGSPAMVAWEEMAARLRAAFPSAVPSYVKR